MNSVMVNNTYELFENGSWFSHKTNRFLKPYVNSTGYERVCICENGKKKHTFTHIAIIKYFGDCKGNRLPNNFTLRELGYSIDHIDQNKHNNARENLELVTHSENLKRMWQHKHEREVVDKLPF